MEDPADDRTEFLARLQHALRTPLTAIIGMGELAIQYWDKWDDAARKEMVADSLVAAQHLYRLTDIITDPLMSDPSSWRPEKAATSIADAVTIAVDTVRRHLDAGDVPVKVDLSDLPGVNADAARIAQAIAELTENAVGNAAEGTEVTISARGEGGTVVIEITNHGVTIPADKIDTYFSPFARGTPSARRRFNGLGMGLPIARRIARAHGGDVTLTSDAGVTVARLVIATA